MNAAVILNDNTIAAIIVADPSVDSIPSGYPADASFIQAPEGTSITWTYDPVKGFIEPPPAPPGPPINKVDF